MRGPHLKNINLKVNFCELILGGRNNGRVEWHLFSGAKFSNLAPAEVDEGAEVHEGNPCVLWLSYTLELP